MNELFATYGLQPWKPFVSILLLPPLPLLVLILIGARLMFRRRLLAWLLVLTGTVGIYLCCTPGFAHFLMTSLLKPPPALSMAQVAELKRMPHTAIVVLGGGRRELAPEYGISTLKPRTAERLRFGLWLGRETNLPVAFSGGVGYNATGWPSEAEVATRVAEREYGRTLRWTEGESRDTHENAVKTVALLQPHGIQNVVLVTEQYHMPRALRNFVDAAQARGMKVIPAPMAVSPSGRTILNDWLPGLGGFDATWVTLHEALGMLMGA